MAKGFLGIATTGFDKPFSFMDRTKWESVFLSHSGKDISFSSVPQCGNGKRTGTRDGGTGLHPLPQEPGSSSGYSSPPWVRGRAMTGAEGHSSSCY